MLTSCVVVSRAVFSLIRAPAQFIVVFIINSRVIAETLQRLRAYLRTDIHID